MGEGEGLMLERSSDGTREMEGARPPGERVGAIGVGDRAVPLYSHKREPVTYESSAVWIVVGVLVILFAIFFGIILFVH